MAKEADLKESTVEEALITAPRLEPSPPQYTEREDQLPEQLDCSKND